MTSLSFRERMSGWIDFDWDDYNQALLHGRRAGRRCEFRLTMHVADVDRYVADPQHAARVVGTVTCDELGGDLEVEDGTMNLFVDQRDRLRRPVQEVGANAGAHDHQHRTAVRLAAGGPDVVEVQFGPVTRPERHNPALQAGAAA